MKWRNGDYYNGRFRNGKKHGKGYYICTDKNIEYEGEFKDGKFHGQETLSDTDGRVLKGTFADGKFVGK